MLVEAQLIKTKKVIIIRFVIACSLPRVILPSNKDKLHLDSNMWIKANSLVLLRLLDSLYLKLTQLFTILQKCNRCHLVTQRQWLLMINMFLEKQFSWLRILLVHCNRCNNLALNNSLDSRLLLNLFIKEPETSMLGDNHHSMDLVSIFLIDLV